MKLVLAFATLHAATAHAGTCETERRALEKRCAANDLDACLTLGVYHHIAADTCYPRRDSAPMVSALQRSCDAGDGGRCTQLADALWDGPRTHGGFSSEKLGLRPDPVRAIALWERGCKLDYPLACEALVTGTSAPKEAAAVVVARSDAANKRLAQIELRGCTGGTSYVSCYAVAERLRTGHGIAVDRKLADALRAKGKVLEDLATAEFRRIHDGNW